MSPIRLTAIYLLYIVSAQASSVQVQGARQVATIRITPQLAGLALPPSARSAVWALGFSPDGKRLLIGAEFSTKKGRLGPLSYDTSCILLLSVDQPGTLLKRFNVEPRSRMRNASRVLWTPYGRFVLVPIYGDLQLLHSAVLDLSTGELKVSRNAPCEDVALIAGGHVLQCCSAC